LYFLKINPIRYLTICSNRIMKQLRTPGIPANKKTHVSTKMNV
jgi:hypothetical protein